ncbi:Origin recognition complex, subunit 1 [Rhodotorula kratochvilovae]
MPPAAPTDAWVSSNARSAQLPSPSTTPTKRASRSSGVSNDVDHAAFERTAVDPNTGFALTLEFRVGDTVVVGEHAKLKQKFLAPPTYLVPPKKTKGKQRARDAHDEEAHEGHWRHEDGLRPGDKVAVITRLFEDVRGRKMATVRWFARPGAVWGEHGPDEDHDEFGEVMPYELYFTSDSTHLQESRLMRQKAASNPFSSSPSSSPSKSRSRSSAHSTPPRTASSFLSSAASFRTPLHSDAIPISTIVSSAEVFSPTALENATITAAQQQPLPMFVCTRVYDVKPVRGAGFWGEVEWDEMRRKAVEWYEDKMGDGERDVAQDAWDVEPVMEVSEEEDSEEEREKEARRKARSEKAKVVAKERKVRERERGGDSAEESSDDSGDEDTFAASDASSSSDSDNGESGSETDEQSSDEESFPRTPTKSTKRSARQLPTPSSSHSTRRTAPISTKAKRARPTAAAESGRQAKRRRFAATSTRKGGASGSGASGTANALPPLLQASELAKLSAFDRAKALLHVSATPESLPCREEQRERIRQFLGDAILGRTGGCLYVHGVPGTGKTATVHSVVRELQNDEDMDGFTFVEINGMKISEPMAAFSHLWSALAPPEQQQQRRASPKAALAALENHFANPDPARKTTVVLVDELDQMLTKRQDVLYNFFNWPHVAHSRLVVVAVANTMDLPERELSGKIRSRLGTNRIPFQPYTWMELKRILEARLALVSPSASTIPLFDDVALQKIAKSVAGISGDARKALDVARRTLDRVALRLSAEGGSLAALQKGAVKCTIQDATHAYNDMTRQGPAAFVRRLSTHAKVLLLALAQCVRRAGVPDVELDTVLTWHLDFLRQTALCAGDGPTKMELVGIVAQLHALRLVATESQRLDVFQRVRASVDEGDLFAALREDETLKGHVPKVL